MLYYLIALSIWNSDSLYNIYNALPKELFWKSIEVSPILQFWKRRFTLGF